MYETVCISLYYHTGWNLKPHPSSTDDQSNVSSTSGEVSVATVQNGDGAEPAVSSSSEHHPLIRQQSSVQGSMMYTLYIIIV